MTGRTPPIESRPHRGLKQFHTIVASVTPAKGSRRYEMLKEGARYIVALQRKGTRWFDKAFDSI